MSVHATRPAARLLLVLLSLFTLACMCGDMLGDNKGISIGGDGPLGSNASDRAVRMADYKAKEERVPAGAFGVGDEVVLGDLSYRFGTPEIVDVEQDVAYIQNSDERAAFSKTGAKGLVLPYAIRNDAPMAKSSPQSVAIITGEGEVYYAQPYNSALWAKAHGRTDITELGKLSPDQWTETARVYAINPASLDGSLIYLAHVTSEWEEEADGDAKKVRTFYGHAVVDIETPVPGEAIVGVGKTRKGSGTTSRDASGRRVRPGGR